ncbi:MAG: HD domain-containing protein [Nitrospiraceae bacterium]|nr:HD domain-containing protein [Nitrospiraceae bacterium]
MQSSVVAPINPTAQLLHGIMMELRTLDSLSLPLSSREYICHLTLCRLARRIETALPHHYGHGEQAAHYAMRLGQEAGLSPEDQTELHYAALLHDIGLLTVPKHLTDPSATLTPEEYILVQSHSREGAQLLSEFRFLGRAALWIAHHHEHWDGSGYPYGLRGFYVPLPARILAVADSFDMLVRQSGSAARACRLLQASSGTQFDPSLVALASELLQFPVQPVHAFQTKDASPLGSRFGVECALPQRAGEGASIPPEAPSSSLPANLPTGHMEEEELP